MRRTRKLWIALAVLVMLTPIGLYLPAKFDSGSAWGEWSADELQSLLGFVPKQLERLEGLWNAPLPDYALTDQEDVPLLTSSLHYIVSAVIGVALVAGLTLLFGRILTNKEDPEDAS